MFQIVSPNKLLDLINEEAIELNLYKGKDKVDIAQFLDDISMWMDKNRGLITDKYLPFCVLSVGIIPVQVSAFMYGMFVGKALEKHELAIKAGITKVSKEDVMKEIERNMNFHNGILGDNIKDGFSEKPDDDSEKRKRE